MKIKPTYKLREIADETIVVNQGTTGVDMPRIISLNESARLLYIELVGKDFTQKDVARILVEKYGISNELAMNNGEKWIDILVKCGIIEK